jgi:uncharacterized protein YdhG (YjbR/CyaY superfamily)
MFWYMPQAKKAANKTTKNATKVAKKVTTKVAKKVTTKVAKKVTTKVATQAAKKTSPKAAEPTKGRPSMANKPASIDDYLSHVDPATRKLLQALRQTILKLVPQAEECISYSMPAFRWQGKVIGGFAATREGGSYYPFSGTTLDTLGEALNGYSRTKSGLHFTSDKPLPRALVSKLLEARKAELDG